jgi:hypothetical protein
MGFAVNDPYGRTPTVAFPVSLNVHACASVDTFAEEIVDPVASRVFARSSFEYGHEPDAGAVEAAAPALTVLQPVLAAAVPLPPQAVTSNPAPTSRATLSAVRPVVLVFIEALHSEAVLK